MPISMSEKRLNRLEPEVEAIATALQRLLVFMGTHVQLGDGRDELRAITNELYEALDAET